MLFESPGKDSFETYSYRTPGNRFKKNDDRTWKEICYVYNICISEMKEKDGFEESEQNISWNAYFPRFLMF